MCGGLKVGAGNNHMQEIVLGVHIVLAAILVLFILIQQGKGADAGAAFGAGASGTVFGSRGTGGFLSRTTAVLALLFFCTSSYLAYFHARAGSAGKSIVESLAGEEAPIPSIGPADETSSEVPALPVDADTDGAADDAVGLDGDSQPDQ